MSDVYFNTSVAVIWKNLAAKKSVYVTMNGFVESSQTGRKITLVEFDHDLSKKMILIGDSRVDIDLLLLLIGNLPCYLMEATI